MHSRSKARSASRTLARPSRRGAVLVWFVFLIPMMLLILIAVTDFGTMAVARIELKNAVDAAALSAVKSWELYGAEAAQSDAGIALASNPVSALTMGAGTTRVAADERSPAEADGSAIWLGYVEDAGGLHRFHSTSSGTAPVMVQRAAAPCVRVQQTIEVHGLTQRWLGVAFGPYVMTAESFARLAPESGAPQLVHVDALAEAHP